VDAPSAGVGAQPLSGWGCTPSSLPQTGQLLSWLGLHSILAAPGPEAECLSVNGSIWLRWPEALNVVAPSAGGRSSWGRDPSLAGQGAQLVGWLRVCTGRMSNSDYLQLVGLVSRLGWKHSVLSAAASVFCRITG
jgi:hypothetical protein